MERLNKYKSHNIGLDRDKVLLQAHNPRWKRMYSDEAYYIFDTLKIESLRLYHCGSTSVPGVDAKPIIDILGSVAHLDLLDASKDKLEAIGYEYKGEYGIKGRRYAVLYSPDKLAAYVHLHVFQQGSSEIEKHLNFRDHLSRFEDSRNEYVRVKRQLVDNDKLPRDKYSDSKNPIIQKIQEAADRDSLRQKKIFAITMFADPNSNTEKFLRESFPSNLEVMDLETNPVYPYGSPQSSNDAFYSIIEKAVQSDLFVITTPVYWYAMSGPIKDFMDRFSNLMGAPHKHLGEALQGKRVQLVATGYDPKLPFGFEVPFAGISIYFGMDYMGALYKSMR